MNFETNLTSTPSDYGNSRKTSEVADESLPAFTYNSAKAGRMTCIDLAKEEYKKTSPVTRTAVTAIVIFAGAAVLCGGIGAFVLGAGALINLNPVLLVPAGVCLAVAVIGIATFIGYDIFAKHLGYQDDWIAFLDKNCGLRTQAPKHLHDVLWDASAKKDTLSKDQIRFLGAVGLTADKDGLEQARVAFSLKILESLKYDLSKRRLFGVVILRRVTACKDGAYEKDPAATNKKLHMKLIFLVDAVKTLEENKYQLPGDLLEAGTKAQALIETLDNSKSHSFMGHSKVALARDDKNLEELLDICGNSKWL